MAGHSKWANTKHRKAAVDAKKNKIFSNLAKDIMIAAKNGGDPAFNPRLRTAIQKAKAANMPNDRINAAVKKGSGEDGGADFIELTYEGYAPGGVGMMIEVTTDNKNRSASDVRSTFTKGNGQMAEPGAVAYNFSKMGQFLIAADKVESEDQLMELALEAGAQDVKNNGDHFEVLCDVEDYYNVAGALEDAAIEPDSSELAYLPNATIEVTDADIAKQIMRLEEKLDDLDDVKAVWANYEIAEGVLEPAEA
ncbi:MAG: YebC/PmpR family DNA-binding transcriptional regulator [Opitutales bacterium]